ncbi:MAG: sulfotransferase [Gammaproteobacteria bacterium]|jgi:tetratricopeptide (TPR) repeat protein
MQNESHNSPDSPLAQQLASAERLRQEGRIAESAAAARDAVALAPEHAPAWNCLGKALNNLGQLEQAADAFRKAIELAPEDPEIHNNLGHVLRATGKSAEALACFDRALALRPDYARAQQNKSTTLLALGREEEALAACRRAARLAPDSVDSALNLADLLWRLDRFDEALNWYRKVQSLAPGRPEGYCGEGAALESLRQPEAALQAYKRALDKAPGDARAAAGAAGLLELTGEYHQGLALLETADETPMTVILRARLLQRTGRPEDAQAALEKLLAQHPEVGDTLADVHFALGTLLDQTGEYERAFASYARGNAMRAGRYDRDRHERLVEAVLTTFAPERIGRLAAASGNDPRPVFIIGMPRSGTSLLEQMLACHPDVHGAGEVRVMSSLAAQTGVLANGVPYPASLEKLRPTDLEGLADRYARRIGPAWADSARVIDKLPANFMHVGFINALFPGARFLHMVRNPDDVALSCFFQNFVTQPFSFHLGDIGHYYAAYRRLMRHWKSLNRLRILDVDYALLVSDTETALRSILEFLDLPWNDACLAPQRSKRLVNTASHAQVREQIHTRALNRARPYARHLQPFREALAEFDPQGDPQ